MRKIFSPVFLAFLLLTSSLALFLNTSVTTKKGNNYIITKTELPLYLKLLGFFDRHFNYQLLVKQIAGHLKTPEEKVFKLFQWTYETIRPQQKSLPIMDSHVWDVIFVDMVSVIILMICFLPSVIIVELMLF